MSSDDEFDRLFKKMSRSFLNLDDLYDEIKNNGSSAGPFYYGYSMSTDSQGKPVVKEYGNIKPGYLPTSDKREPFVDTIVNEKEKIVKFIAEIPGVEKSDIKVQVHERTVDIDAEHGDKKFHATVPLKHKVDENSANATYKNGILELTLKLLETEKPKGKTVEIQ